MTHVTARELEARRRFFAEEIQVIANLKTEALVAALATVPREHFLPPGPWTIRGEGDIQAPPRLSADDDPRHVSHNISVAIDPARTLFNGAPALLAMAIDTLQLAPGHRALHLGTGMGYYTALMARCVGETGRVVGIEVDPDLADASRSRLASMPWVDVRTGDGAAGIDGPFDAILINAGVTHPLPAWLDALSPRGRLLVPLTATMPGPSPIGKGWLLLITRSAEGETYAVRLVTFVAIYSALGIRDEATNTSLGAAMQKHPYPPVRSFRRDAHEITSTCWLHTPSGCFSLA